MAENLLHDLPIIDHGDDAHGVLADRTAERVTVPDFEDEVAPFAGGKVLRRGR